MDNATVLPARHKLTVHDYHRIAEAGIFGDNNKRIELIDGDLIDMAPIGQGHEAIVNELTEAFVLACAGRAIVSIQNSVRLDLSNESQPDLAILRRRADFYATGDRAGPADVLLLIEVAETSLRFDRFVKLPLYARVGIPEFWIVDLKRRLIDVYRTPAGDAYRQMTTYQPSDQLTLALAPEITVRLALVFG